jgi:cytochrome b
LREAIIWPRFVRLTHWLIATLVVVNWFNETGEWHRLLGYTAVAVVAIRVTYGMLTSVQAARFYWPGRRQLCMHIRSILHGQAEHSVGHNPLGQLAVYLIWMLLALLALTGWISRTDTFWGEEWPVAWHGYLSASLQVLVLLHVVAVLLMSRIQRTNLIKGMLLGKKL